MRGLFIAAAIVWLAAPSSVFGGDQVQMPRPSVAPGMGGGFRSGGIAVGRSLQEFDLKELAAIENPTLRTIASRLQFDPELIKREPLLFYRLGMGIQAQGYNPGSKIWKQLSPQRQAEIFASAAASASQEAETDASKILAKGEHLTMAMAVEVQGQAQDMLAYDEFYLSKETQSNIKDLSTRVKNFRRDYLNAKIAVYDDLPDQLAAGAFDKSNTYVKNGGEWMIADVSPFANRFPTLREAFEARIAHIKKVGSGEHLKNDLSVMENTPRLRPDVIAAVKEEGGTEELARLETMVAEAQLRFAERPPSKADKRFEAGLKALSDWDNSSKRARVRGTVAILRRITDLTRGPLYRGPEKGSAMTLVRLNIAQAIIDRWENRPFPSRDKLVGAYNYAHNEILSGTIALGFFLIAPIGGTMVLAAHGWLLTLLGLAILVYGLHVGSNPVIGFNKLLSWAAPGSDFSSEVQDKRRMERLKEAAEKSGRPLTIQTLDIDDGFFIFSHILNEAEKEAAPVESVTEKALQQARWHRLSSAWRSFKDGVSRIGERHRPVRHRGYRV